MTLMDREGYTQDGTVDLRGRPVLAANTGRWRACAFLLGYEAFERMAFYGVASNLVVYLTTQLHEDTVSSVRSVNNWSGSVWITPILGAFIADSYFGRFWTFTISSLIYVLGMILLTMAVSLKSLRPVCGGDGHGDCSKATSSQMAFFYSALYVMAIGAGGTKPNISTFGADQFDDFDADEKKLKVSFFNWWMFSSFLGGLMATLGLVYIQDNLGWGVGYAIPTAGLIVSLLIFYVGTPNYRHKVRKTENPAREVVRVLVVAFANRRLRLPEDPKELHELETRYYLATGKRRVHHTSPFRFLDKAALKDERRPNPCTVTQVEETKLILGMSIIWLTTLIPCTIFAQVNTLFVKQGTSLDRSLGNSFTIPAASLGSFVTISMLLAIPLYDRYFVPFMRRRTSCPHGITLLQRLGIGFASHILVTAVAYSVELRRMRVISNYGITAPDAVVPMSIFWLLPQYVLLGVGDVFVAIGLLEFFYDQSPEDMQSLGTTFFTSGIGVGNFLNSLFVTVVDKATRRGGGKSWIGNNLNESHLDYYYGFLMGISVVNMVVFVWVARRYNYKVETMEGVVAPPGMVESVEMEKRSAGDDGSPLALQV